MVRKICISIGIVLIIILTFYIFEKQTLLVVVKTEQSALRIANRQYLKKKYYNILNVEDCYIDVKLENGSNCWKILYMDKNVDYLGKSIVIRVNRSSGRVIYSKIQK